MHGFQADSPLNKNGFPAKFGFDMVSAVAVGRFRPARHIVRQRAGPQAGLSWSSSIFRNKHPDLRQGSPS